MAVMTFLGLYCIAYAINPEIADVIREEIWPVLIGFLLIYAFLDDWLRRPK